MDPILDDLGRLLRLVETARADYLAGQFPVRTYRGLAEVAEVASRLSLVMLDRILVPISEEVAS